MQCKVCEYRLWNLKARRCPECGTPFCVSDYEFVPNSVQFCCPHCDQPYYGTGAKGHLVPEAFTCVKCSQPIHMNDTVLLPTEGLEEEQTQTFRVPWTERKKRGWFRSWFATVGLSLTSPSKLIRALPAEGSLGSAWWFMIATAFLVQGVWAVPLAIFALLARIVAGGLTMSIAPIGGFLVVAVAAPIVVSAGVALWGVITHGLLRLTGRTSAGPARTYQGLCYSSGTYTLSVIPCFPYVGIIWWLISAVVMVKEGQRVHAGRAAFAVLTLPVLAGGTLIGLYIWFMMSVMARMPFPTTMPAGGSLRTPAVTATAQSQRVLSAIRTYARRNNNQGPRHAIELIDLDDIEASDLLIPSSITTLTDVPVGRSRLDLFETLPPDERKIVIQQAIDALPVGTVAHRLGDYVFTYHGIDFGNAKPNLWLLIEWPDPAVNRAVSPADLVTIHQADGTVFSIPSAAFKGMLQQQNILRKHLGLPPLPDPATITHAKPAVAPAEQPEF